MTDRQKPEELAERLRALNGEIVDLTPQQIDATLTDVANAVEALQRQVEAARDVINRGVEIMEDHQVGQWTGVRAWLEMDTAAFATHGGPK